MRSIKTKKQIAEWMNTHDATIAHHWSTRGYGSSRIEWRGDIIARATGCGYDRRGAAMGDAVAHLFPAELVKLARRFCKGRRRYKHSRAFYGLHYDRETDAAGIDGACGFESVERVLNAIGFTLEYIGGTDGNRATGSEFYRLAPVPARALRWITERVASEAKHAKQQREDRRHGRKTI